MAKPVMNILYVSSVCSDERFKFLFEFTQIKPQQQVQKFHNLLVKGLRNNANYLYIMSRQPVSEYVVLNFLDKSEVYDNVFYDYLKILRNPLLRHFSFFVSGFSKTIDWSKANSDSHRIVICDVLNLTISVSSLIASKITKVKSVAIVTDIPDYLQSYSTRNSSLIKRIVSSMYRTVSNFFISKYDYYIVLTEQMNVLVNKNNKPHIVIDGIVDLHMGTFSNELKEKYEDFTIIYSGALFEKYGVKNLIEAFMRLKNNDVKLWLYGSGDMDKIILNFEREDNRIKYFGVVSNEIVIKEQLKATLLVNPRSSKEEFTKYSFPSKNMEYMVSGTPVLTFPLPGMSREYDEYIYLFEDDTIESMTESLNSILMKSRKELHEKGLRAKEFVLTNKNYDLQAKRLIELIKK